MDEQQAIQAAHVDAAPVKCGPGRLNKQFPSTAALAAMQDVEEALQPLLFEDIAQIMVYKSLNGSGPCTNWIGVRQTVCKLGVICTGKAKWEPSTRASYFAGAQLPAF
jgi:hypothetical protein